MISREIRVDRQPSRFSSSHFIASFPFAPSMFCFYYSFYFRFDGRDDAYTMMALVDIAVSMDE